MTAVESQADERLLIEAAQKDRSRFGELYEKNFERVYAYVARRVGNRVDAQDVTSEVFHQALANLGSFEWRSVPFVAWLFRIAANALADRWQRAARESGPPSHSSEEVEQPDIEDAERRAKLFRLVKTLPADQRRVILQRFVEQRSVREIAQGLGRSEGAVKQLQFRALENLRARMSDVNG